MSAQSENVLIVQSRNVLLTGAGWGVGNGPTPDDAERARPAGGAKESQEETDHAKAGGCRDRRKRAASTAYAGEPERPRGQGGRSCGPRPAIQSTNRRVQTEQGHQDPEPGCLSRIRTNVGGRVSGTEAPSTGEPGNAARMDDRGPALACQSQASGEGPYLASAAQSRRGTGAMGYQRARLAGRPRPQAVFDQHDRRCQQPHAGAVCGARFNGREHASA